MVLVGNLIFFNISFLFEIGKKNLFKDVLDRKLEKFAFF